MRGCCAGSSQRSTVSRRARAEADAAARRRTGVLMQEHRRAAPGDDRVRVVVEHREGAVRARRAPERLAGPAERRPRPAGDVPERVVRGRGGVLVPPVSADESVVAVAHARVGAEPVHDPGERERADRRRPVALAMVSGQPVPADARRPRRARRHPAAARAPPQSQRSARRTRSCSLDRDQLPGSPGRGEAVCQIHAAPWRRRRGGKRGSRRHERRHSDAGGHPLDYPHGDMVPVCRVGALVALAALAPIGAAESSPPRFVHSVAAVTRAELGRSYHAGCPVGPSELRLVRLRYWGFDHRAHNGSLVASRKRRAGAGRGIRTAVRRALPDPTHGADRRLRRQRPRFDGGRQHLGLQLPVRGRTRASPLVGARARRGDRREHRGEPVRGGRRGSASRGQADTSTARASGPEWPCPAAPSCGRSQRSAGSGAAAGPGRRTTSTSRPRAGSDKVAPMGQTKFVLPESELPRRWYNIAADMPNPAQPPLHPAPASRSARTTWRRSSRWR